MRFLWLFSMMLLGLLWTSPSDAEERLAVLEIQNADLPDKLLGLVSDQLRSGVQRAVDGQGITLMTRENIAVILEDMGVDASCVEGQCEVETGRNLRASYVVSASLDKLEDEYVLTVKMHGTEKGVLIATQTLLQRNNENYSVSLRR